MRAAGARVTLLAASAYSPSALDDKWLAVLTERDLGLGARMASDANARRVFFCATDQPQPNGYSHLALVRAGTVTIAIGTEGRVPALGRRLRQELTRVCERAGLAQFAEKLAALRQALPPAQRQAALMERVQGVHFSGELELPPLE